MTQGMAENVQVVDIGLEVVVDSYRCVDEVVEVVQENDDPVGSDDVKGK
jgi:hypothetical protein